MKLDKDTIIESSLECYPVQAPSPVQEDDPLHVKNFYPGMKRTHRGVMEQRQSMILYFAYIHGQAVKSGMPLAFCQIPMSLLKLRKWVYDYRTIFDHFFEVYEAGFRIDDKNKDISIVIPKKLGDEVRVDSRALTYVPPPLPDHGVVSKAFIQFHNAKEIRQKLIDTKRFDLVAPVEWLLNRPIDELNVWYAPSGKLQLRDTSIWPIRAIETWPSWLRVLLFGEGIDIESAYTQYLLNALRESLDGDEKQMKLLFPSIVRSLEDKHGFRRDLLHDIGLKVNDDNLTMIKRVCMALANGSKVSGKMLSGASPYSCIKDVLVEKLDDISATNLDRIGVRLAKIAKEHALAKKLVCIHEQKKFPSRANQKTVFTTYFQWEREARYKIWNAIGNYGIMVHDGIEGIPASILNKAQAELESLEIRISTT